MDARPDTSSGRSHDGSSWSFLHLNHASPPSAQDAQVFRSRPPSSYLVGSDRSSASPLPHGRHPYNASRSSRTFSRNIPSASTGARSTTTTLPSHPVLSRIDSDYAYNHNNQFVRRNRRGIMTDPRTGLPAVKEFSIAGILAAIHEDIEGDVNTIAEILGRHRFAPADEYDAQMPPQGEIVGQESLLEEEAGPSHVGDNVMILNEEASLVEGSNSGSAAYGLLERLQAHPRPTRMTSDAPIVTRPARHDAVSPEPTRTLSSPAVLQPESQSAAAEANVRPPKPVKRHQRHRSRLPARGPSGPVVSETWLSAEANGVSSGMVPTVSEAGRHYPLYTHEDIGLFETTAFDRDGPRHSHQFLHWTVPTFSTFTSWFSGGRHNSDQGAEATLRSLLAR